MERTEIKFVEHALSMFSFLTEEYGFSGYSEGDTLVRFCKKQLEVRIFHGRQSFEIGVEISKAGKTYHLSTLMELAGAKHVRLPAARDEVLVSRFLAEAAEQLKTHGRSLLDEDSSLFNEIEGLQLRKERELERSTQVANLRKRANEAFRSCDYATALKLYSLFADSLSRSEEKRIEICKKRMFSS